MKKSFRWHLLLLGTLLLIGGGAFQVRALDPGRSLFQYNCRTWRRANGLPANSVSAIAQSKDGRLWLGTSQGLVYFDGISFRVFNLAEDQNADNGVITSLAQRSDGGLWFGLDRGGFGVFNGTRFEFMGRSEWAGPSLTVRSVSEATDGALLLTANFGAARVGNGGALMTFLPGTSTDTFSILQDPQGRIWIGTAELGLFYWQDGKLNQFPDPTLQNTIISALAVDLSGNIWVGTTKGLRCYDGANFKNRLSVNQAQPKAILVDRHGAIWIGAYGSGLTRYYRGEFSSFKQQDGLASDQVLSLYESRDGSIWVGTEDGLTQLSDVKFPIFSATEGLVSEAALDYQHGKFQNYGFNGANGLGSVWVKRIFVASNGDAYLIGANKNIDLFRKDHVITSWTNSLWPRAIAEDTNGILVALAGDLMRIQDGQLVPFHLADGQKVYLYWINDLLVARDGSIWLAHDNGVCQIQNGILHDWYRENGGANTRFSYLCEADDGAVWAAQSGGIVRFKNGKWSLITRKQGLHEDFVYAIVPDQFGNFWMDSNRGIFRVSQKELNAVADGLGPENASGSGESAPSPAVSRSVHCEVFEGENAVKTTDKTAQEYSGCRSLDGRIWFPSSKGVIMINPANVATNSLPAVVSIERIRINGQEYRPDRQPVLRPGPGNLEFDYEALDYQAPQKIQYRYRLTGFDTDWVNAGNRREAFYTNLKPGQYRFEVQACNADGVWDTAGAGYGFELPPEFYEMAGFRLACIALALGLTGYVWWAWHLRQRHHLLQQTSALLETKVEERTSELRKEIEERKRIQVENERVHRELMDASRRAGMAEVATSVLHNVGNALNSVNISINVLATQANQPWASNTSKIAELLKQHRGALPQFLARENREGQLISYMEKLAEQLAAEQSAAVKELKELGKNVDHIKDIVAMQQNYAKVSGVTEIVKVTDLVEDALAMHARALIRHDVKVVRDFSPGLPDITVEKHKVLQILVNLIHNAKYACDQSGKAEKQLTLRVAKGGDFVRIAVADNGVGISRENLSKIFTYGFTTRKNGHGFGLHSSVLAAQELNGSLRVQSEGPDQGAIFTLELPLKPKAQAP